MANTNTPLSTIEQLEAAMEYRKQHFNADNLGEYMVPGKVLAWLLADAKHLNELNSFAIERRFEDAATALKALADYEG